MCNLFLDQNQFSATFQQASSLELVFPKVKLIPLTVFVEDGKFFWIYFILGWHLCSLLERDIMCKHNCMYSQAL